MFNYNFIFVLTAIMVALAAFPAWITHVIFCFVNDMWGFLIVGAIFFPVAIMHGWYLWFKWLFI